MDQTDSKICTRGGAPPAGAVRHLRSKGSTFEASDVILVMFYSTDPASDGYVLTSAGHAVRKSASVGAEASATASLTATTATVGALPTSGGHSPVGPIVLVAVLVLMGSGMVVLGSLRRGAS